MKKVTIEDYLVALYRIYEDFDGVETKFLAVDLANVLGVKKPTVSRSINSLVELGFIKSGFYSKIEFTEKGLNLAKKVMFKHRIIEMFLVKILGYGDEVCIHDEAHDLEHTFSDESVLRMDRLLGFPEKTLIGKIIPRDFTDFDFGLCGEGE